MTEPSSKPPERPATLKIADQPPTPRPRILILAFDGLNLSIAANQFSNLEIDAAINHLAERQRRLREAHAAAPLRAAVQPAEAAPATDAAKGNSDEVPS